MSAPLRCPSMRVCTAKAVAQVVYAGMDGVGAQADQRGDLRKIAARPLGAAGARPVTDTKNRSTLGAGAEPIAGLRRRRASAVATDGCKGTSRIRSNLACRIVTRPSTRSTSARVEGQGFPQAHAGGGQQPEQRPVGGGPQRWLSAAAPLRSTSAICSGV